MTLTERLRADYAGRGVALGRHPMASPASLSLSKIRFGVPLWRNNQADKGIALRMGCAPSGDHRRAVQTERRDGEPCPPHEHCEPDSQDSHWEHHAPEESQHDGKAAEKREARE